MLMWLLWATSGRIPCANSVQLLAVCKSCANKTCPGICAKLCKVFGPPLRLGWPWRTCERFGFPERLAIHSDTPPANVARQSASLPGLTGESPHFPPWMGGQTPGIRTPVLGFKWLPSVDHARLGARVWVAWLCAWLCGARGPWGCQSHTSAGPQ